MNEIYSTTIMTGHVCSPCTVYILLRVKTGIMTMFCVILLPCINQIQTHDCIFFLQSIKGQRIELCVKSYYLCNDVMKLSK